MTITTGTSFSSGKDFVVGASAKDDKTDSISGSIGGKNIDLGSSGRNISVVGGHYLTLVGGSSDTPLVTAGGNPVNVHVGGTGEGASGVLNLGTPVMDSGGTLSGNIEIAAASTVNVRAGTHVITGEANEITGTADVAGMNNNGGTINIAEGAHLQSTIRQADGQTNVSGKLTSALLSSFPEVPECLRRCGFFVRHSLKEISGCRNAGGGRLDHIFRCPAQHRRSRERR